MLPRISEGGVGVEYKPDAGGLGRRLSEFAGETGIGDRGRRGNRFQTTRRSRGWAPRRLNDPRHSGQTTGRRPGLRPYGEFDGAAGGVGPQTVMTRATATGGPTTCSRQQNFIGGLTRKACRRNRAGITINSGKASQTGRSDRHSSQRSGRQGSSPRPDRAFNRSWWSLLPASTA